MKLDDIAIPESQQLIALPPAKRAAVALKSEAAEAHLRQLVAKSAEITNVVDKNGREEAHRAAMGLKNARVNIKNTGEEAREDAVAFQKAVVSEVARLAAITAEEEKRLLALRDAFDAKVAAEKAERERIEAERVAAIRAKIEDITTLPIKHAASSSSSLNTILAALALRTASELEFAEFAGDAALAIDATAGVLINLRNTARQREEAEAERKRLADEEQKRVAAEREELAKLRAEQEARAKAERAATAERERLAQIERDKAEAERRAAAEREAELIRQINQMQRDLADRLAAAEEKRRPQDIAEDDAYAFLAAWDEAISEDKDRAQATPLAFNSDSQETVEVIAPPLANSEKIMRRPSDEEMVEVLATHYGVSEDTVIAWLKSYCL